MFNQHAKWLEKSKKELEWCAPAPSINILITSLVWRQDHKGFTHQDPGFLDVVTNKSPDVVRIYLPPDANCLLSVADHCLRSRNYFNVIVADKQDHLQYLKDGLTLFPFGTSRANCTAASHSGSRRLVGGAVGRRRPAG
jgi:xylulose-5-phosphate/fructose-6-phosphate phosphoketolase